MDMGLLCTIVSYGFPKFCFPGLPLRDNSPFPQHISGFWSANLWWPVLAGAQPFSRNGHWSWASQVPAATSGAAVWAGVRPGPAVGASTYQPRSPQQHLCGFATFNTTSAIYLTLSSNFTHLQN